MKKYKKKYTYDWQKDALNYHASVKSHVAKMREKDHASGKGGLGSSERQHSLSIGGKK